MPVVRIVGHRGVKGEVPENTVAGFTYAKSIGLAAVEFDVRMSRDNELVVIHDRTVDRTTNGSGPVQNFTAAELGALDARGSCPDWPDPVGVPTLDQALEEAGDLETLQIEIKSDHPERLEDIVCGVLKAIAARSLGRQAIVTSFDPVAIEIVQRLAPQQAHGFIGRPDNPEIVQTARRLGCTHTFLHQFRSQSADVVEEAHAVGLQVGGGPCDTVEDLTYAIDWKMDSITSDVPSILLSYLQMT